jgi:hypothetical protein
LSPAFGFNSYVLDQIYLVRSANTGLVFCIFRQFLRMAGEKAFVGGVFGGGAGVLVGAVIGRSSEKKFLINGEWESLQEMKASLQK